jgi:hypothetical protein
MSTMVKILALVTVLAIPAGSAQAKQGLAVLDGQFDFGSVPQGSTVAHRFRLVTTGEEAVKITEIKTGCSCIALWPSGLVDSATTLSPGDTLDVTILWQVRLSTGKVSRQVLVLTEAAPEPIRVELRASIAEPGTELAAPVACRPAIFEFGRAAGKLTSTIPLELVNSTGNDLTTELVSGQWPEVAVAIPDSLRAGQKAVGSVGVVQGFEEHEFERSLTLSFKRGTTEIYRQTFPVSLGDFSYRPMSTK